MMERYIVDMHVHTKETSACGEVAGADVVRSYKEAGYQGIMISDHYHKEFFDGLGSMEIHQKIERYLAGYRAAKREGEKLGVDVLLGIEFRNFESDNDFLIIGMTEEFLHDYPETYLLPINQAVELFHRKGMLVIQAHPVRFKIVDQKDGTVFQGYKNCEMLEMLKHRPEIKEVFGDRWDGSEAGKVEEYPFMLRVSRLLCEDDLDGIEAYNGNYHWSQRPELIQEILEKHPDYIQTSSSDFHEPGHLARGGIVLNRRVKDSQELKQALLDRGIVDWIRR